MTEDSSEVSTGAVARVRWSTIAIGAVIVAVGCLGTLAIVASVKKTDTLATVALALAVLAFVIQIIVFVAQAAAASAQQRDFQRINAETSALLSELRAHAVDTNRVVTTQFDKMLDRLVVQAKGSPEDEVNAEQTASRHDALAEVTATVDALRRAATTTPSTPAQRVAVPRPRRAVSSPADMRRITLRNATISASPSRVSALLHDEALRDLSPPAQKLLLSFASDYVDALLEDFPDGFALDRNASSVAELRARGVLVSVDDNELAALVDLQGEKELFRLSGKGKALASLVTAKAISSLAVEKLPWLAELRQLYVAETKRRTDGDEA